MPGTITLQERDYPRYNHTSGKSISLVQSHISVYIRGNISGTITPQESAYPWYNRSSGERLSQVQSHLREEYIPGTVIQHQNVLVHLVPISQLTTAMQITFSSFSTY